MATRIYTSKEELDQHRDKIIDRVKENIQSKVGGLNPLYQLSEIFKIFKRDEPFVHHLLALTILVTFPAWYIFTLIINGLGIFNCYRSIYKTNCLYKERLAERIENDWKDTSTKIRKGK